MKRDRKYHREPKPEWFEIQNYTRSSDLNDADSWYVQIGTRLNLQHYQSMKENANDSHEFHEYERICSDLFEQIKIQGVLPVSYSKKGNVNDPFPDHKSNSWSYMPVRPLANHEVYGKAYGNDEHEKEMMRKIMANNNSHSGYSTTEIEKLESWGMENFNGDLLFDMYVGIDLGLEDKVILQNMKQWLKSARPTGFRDKNNITSKTFSDWKKFRILAFWDIEYWKEINNLKYSRDEIAEFMFQDPKSQFDAENIRKSVVPKYRSAFKLYSQLKHLAS